jgi:hypothetical protein
VGLCARIPDTRIAVTRERDDISDRGRGRVQFIARDREDGRVQLDESQIAAAADRADPIGLRIYWVAVTSRFELPNRISTLVAILFPLSSVKQCAAVRRKAPPPTRLPLLPACPPVDKATLSLASPSRKAWPAPTPALWASVSW